MKDDLLKRIAETAYNIGYGAKLHFASYDMAEKIPGFINFISMAFGIYALAFQNLSTNFLSATLLVFGIISVYISAYNSNKKEYYDAGIEHTKKLDNLKRLMARVKTSKDDAELEKYGTELAEIEDSYRELRLSKQILFCSWYAHYKFFWEHQIAWIEEHRKFTFWRDKVPLSFWLVIVLAILAYVFSCFNLMSYLCSLIKG